MIDCVLLIYLIIGVVEGIIIFIFKSEIFDYNSELGFNTIAQKTNKKGDVKYYLKDKRKAYSQAPFEQKLWVFMSMVLGTVLGWVLLWFLLDRRLNYFSNADIKWEDLALFLLSYIGISGRLHTVAESVQQWFKR